MTDKTRRVSATSHWRDRLDEAKRECNRILDSKVEEVVADEEHDGWYLVAGSYSSFSNEHDEDRSLYRSSRSKTLRFREYEAGLQKAALDHPIPADFIDAIISGAPVGTTGDARQDSVVQHVIAQLKDAAQETADLGGDAFFANLQNLLRPLVPQTKSIKIGLGAASAPIYSIDFEAVVITQSNLRLDDNEELVGIPLSETVTIIPVLNCGSNISLDIHRKLEYVYVTGFRVELTQEVSTTRELNGKLTFEGAGELGGSFSKQVTFSESREYSSSTSESREESIDISVPPQTKATIRLVSQRFEAQRVFQGPVVIDCDVLVTYGWAQGNINKVDRYRLSGLLQDESSRTFVAEGKYANLDTRIQPIVVLPEDC